MYGVEKTPQGKRLDNKNSTPGARRVLLFVTADTISEAIVYAVEKEFPWISVEQVPDIEAACGMFDATVSLIVVDTSLIDQLEERSAELANLHPSALIAMMQDSRRNMPADRILAAPAVRGILPMDMKLDIWLSIVRLLLRGGEYFPPQLFKGKTVGKKVNSPGDGKGFNEPPSDGWSDLTEREVQILEMVARGLQNKVIAAALKLSENTVKIHLHNIIRKLGAHNRTEAAAMYFARYNRQ
jgi:DNA-binding NarL/FixJ family response regulator